MSMEQTTEFGTCIPAHVYRVITYPSQEIKKDAP